MKRSAILLACLLLYISPGWAEQPAEKTIDLDMNASKTRLVIAAFFAAADKQYQVDPAVADADTPPLAVKGMPLESALKWLCKQLDVTCQLKSNIYELRPDTSQIEITPIRCAAGPRIRRAPAVGMSKPEIIALLGKPTAITGEIAGYEVWTYSRWEIGFRQSRVSRTGSPPESSIRMRIRDCPVFFESGEAQQDPTDTFHEQQQLIRGSMYYRGGTIGSVFDPCLDPWTLRGRILRTCEISLPKPPSD